MTPLWKLRNRLFGAHFVLLHTVSDTQIARCHVTPTGHPYALAHGQSHVWLEPDGKTRGCSYVTRYEPLTWEPPERKTAEQWIAEKVK